MREFMCYGLHFPNEVGRGSPIESEEYGKGGENSKRMIKFGSIPERTGKESPLLAFWHSKTTALVLTFFHP